MIEDGDSGDAEASDSSSSASTFSLADIENNGELIMLTLSGPSTYYDYKGVGLGKDYLLCEKFASSIGVFGKSRTLQGYPGYDQQTEKGQRWFNRLSA